jgi:V8-like Glu-specific endopeptidase
VRSENGSQPTQPVNVFNAHGQDPREGVDLSRDRALRPIVQVNGTTAFLVSPCYALAAYHAVFGFAKAGDSKPSVPVLIWDEEQGGPTFKTVAASPEMWGDGHIQSAIREDWVLLKLSTCEGKRIGWLELIDGRTDASLAGQPIVIAGYPNDKPKTRLWRDRTGHVQQEGQGQFLDCLLNSAATRGGNSGSPLYQEEAGIPVVVGLQVRERGSSSGIILTYDARQANIAVDVRSIARRIGHVISGDKDVFWAERPEYADQNPSH